MPHYKSSFPIQSIDLACSYPCYLCWIRRTCQEFLSRSLNISFDEQWYRTQLLNSKVVYSNIFCYQMLILISCLLFPFFLCLIVLYIPLLHRTPPRFILLCRYHILSEIKTLDLIHVAIGDSALLTLTFSRYDLAQVVFLWNLTVWLIHYYHGYYDDRHKTF